MLAGRGQKGNGRIRKRECLRGIRVGDWNAIIATIDPKGLFAQFLFNSQPYLF